MFYIAFLVAEAPGNYMMQKVNIRYVVSVSMLIWGGSLSPLILIARHANKLPNAGVLVLCVAFCKNFADLMVVRTLQGIAGT